MRKLTYIILLHLSFSLFSQVEHVAIQWNRDHRPPVFTHALYEDGENTLPYIVRKLPWTEKGMIPKVQLEVIETSPVDENLTAVMNIQHVKEAPLLEYTLVREAKQSYVMVKVLPFLKGPAGLLMKLETFNVHLDKEMALAALKSEMTGDWIPHSVLASGDWAKISVEKSGMHMLTYEQLAEIGLQNPATVRVFGSGARLLPEMFSEGHMDDLQSVPIHMHKGSDGIFGPGDHILFYARGPVSWKFDPEEDMFVHQLHKYSWKGYYFITDGMGTVHAQKTWI